MTVPDLLRTYSEELVELADDLDAFVDSQELEWLCHRTHSNTAALRLIALSLSNLASELPASRLPRLSQPTEPDR